MACPQGSTKARFHQFSTFGCSQGSTTTRFHPFSTFGWLVRKGPPKLAFINFQPLDARKGSPKLAFINSRPLDGLPARLHQSWHSSLIPHLLLLDLHRSALGELFNYEDRGHIVIGTNLKENAYNLNMKVADFK